MGNSTSGSAITEAWFIVGIFGFIGLIIAIALLVILENKWIGAILLIISIIILLIAAWLWFSRSNSVNFI
uniref:Transmembrane protein n=1 Tax=Pithovirus LCDPAC02 TaxID=2506601 RepID=A0A481YNY8_9VIRU|nr:MAG: hypothetical protein LCDPAC02_01700 [Pithovirus LCDPAC02]